MNDLPLDPSDMRRYARQMILPEIGAGGQRRLKNASVLLVGAGGLGSPVALYLAAAGVGHISLVDPDRIDESNLHRQILHTTPGIGMPKTDSAAARLREINPQLDLTTHSCRFTVENAMSLAAGHQLIIDGSDNFPTRFLANDTAFLTGIPLVAGSVYRFQGQITVYHPREGGPCLRCLLPDLPAPDAVPSCAEAGVLGVLPGIIGTLQASEALKILLGTGEPLIGRLLSFDALATTFRELRLRRDPRCALCGDQASITSVDNPQTRSRNTCSVGDSMPLEIDAATLAARLEAGFDGILLDVREPAEHAWAAIPGSTLVPLRQLPAACTTWPRDTEIIVHCKSGIRSLHALAVLREAGFGRICHLAGGIEAWLSLD